MQCPHCVSVLGQVSTYFRMKMVQHCPLSQKTMEKVCCFDDENEQCHIPWAGLLVSIWGSNACNPWLPMAPCWQGNQGVHCLLTPEELEKASHMKSFRSWMVKDREQKLLRNPGKNIVLRKCHKRGTGQSKKWSLSNSKIERCVAETKASPASTQKSNHLWRRNSLEILLLCWWARVHPTGHDYHLGQVSKVCNGSMEKDGQENQWRSMGPNYVPHLQLHYAMVRLQLSEAQSKSHVRKLLRKSQLWHFLPFYAWPVVNTQASRSSMNPPCMEGWIAWAIPLEVGPRACLLRQSIWNGWRSYLLSKGTCM